MTSAVTGGITLPMAVACAGRLRDEVERHLEAVLGWQVVQQGSGWVHPTAVLADGTCEVPRTPVPVVLLVADDVPAHEAARRAVATGAASVLAWPTQRDRLPELAQQWLAVRAVQADGERLHVAGGSGGTGTTTVALALAGLMAWAARDVLAVVTGDAPVPGIPTVADDSLQTPGLWSASTPAPGVEGLRAVGRGRAPATSPPVVEVPKGVAVVLDLGVAPQLAEVLVVRRDRAGRDAIALSPAGAIALLDDGPLTEAEVLAPAGGRVVAILPRWSRVARANALQRLPADLPATWLEPLRGFVSGDVATD